MALNILPEKPKQMNSLSETCNTVLMISGNFSLAVIWKYYPVAS